MTLTSLFARTALLATLAATPMLGGCSKNFIPNTDVEDKGENLKVIQFCEKYRHALEDKNINELLKMMSPQYFEDGGNTIGDDDADHEQVKKFILGDYMKTTGIRYEIRYRRVTYREEKGRILVDFTYAAAYRIPGVKGEEWRHKVADNRIELVRDGESFKIIAGM